MEDEREEEEVEEKKKEEDLDFFSFFRCPLTTRSLIHKSNFLPSFDAAECFKGSLIFSAGKRLSPVAPPRPGADTMMGASPKR